MTSSIIAIALGIIITSVILIVRKPALAAGAMALCLGASLGCAVACQNLMTAQDIDEGSIDKAVVTVAEDSKATSYGEAAFVDLSFEDGTVVKAYAVFNDGAPLLRGTKAVVSGTWMKPDWSRDEYLWSNGAVGRIRVSSFEDIESASPLKALMLARRMAIDSIGDNSDSQALCKPLCVDTGIQSLKHLRTLAFKHVV